MLLPDELVDSFASSEQARDGRLVAVVRELTRSLSAFDATYERRSP